MNAKRSRFVAGRGDDTTSLWTAPDRDWLATELWVVTLLYRRVERVHVDVDDPTEW